MTAFISCSSPSGPHILPDSLIAAGIDASIIMSLGTWRFVMPKSEFTIASWGPEDKQASKSARTLSRSIAGRDEIFS